MKWIRRKPSLRVRWWVSFFSVIFLSTLQHWVGGLSPGFGYTRSSWTNVFYVHAIGPRSRQLSRGRLATAEMYSIVWRDDRFVIVTERDDEYEAIAEGSESIKCLYRSGYYQSGLWNPTRWHDAVRLDTPYSRFPSSDLWRFDSSLIIATRMRTKLIAVHALDPRLISQTEVAEAHIIWTGYLANALSLLSFLLLAWSFVWSVAWVPGWFRQCRQRRRRALGLCPMCAYNLEGTPGRCPECGWVPGDATAD